MLIEGKIYGKLASSSPASDFQALPYFVCFVRFTLRKKICTLEKEKMQLSSYKKNSSRKKIFFAPICSLFCTKKSKADEEIDMSVDLKRKENGLVFSIFSILIALTKENLKIKKMFNTSSSSLPN